MPANQREYSKTEQRYNGKFSVQSKWNLENLEKDEYTDSPVNKSFRAQCSMNIVMVRVFWCAKRPTTFDLFEKDGSVNCVYY